ncbi:phosphatase PAP2 family protein [Cognatiyoonia sp. IB215182]|nr:phosphatase PAP2 family protein [Cognatiyoonia sp. IB215182]
MLPLGADVTTPGGQTAAMFQTILWLGSLIGLLYKERFNAPRPHVLNPSLEPFIPVPAFSSYPSNHAFQSFLIAEVFTRAVPEHPGGEALFSAAKEVATNREYAGLHVPSDTEAGQLLARLCAPMFEIILEDRIRAVRAEWLGEGYFV